MTSQTASVYTAGISELHSVTLHHPHPKVDGGPPSEHGIGPVSKLWVGGWATETKVMQLSSIYNHQSSMNNHSSSIIVNHQYYQSAIVNHQSSVT